MAIIKDLTITVRNDSATLSENVYLYLGDGGITLLITILENRYKFGSFVSGNTNLIEESYAQWASVCVLKANEDIVTSDRCEIWDNKIRFEITKEFIDEIAEKGTHTLQIHLYDGEDENSNRLTIPPVAFTILEPICNEYALSNVINNAKINRAIVAEDTEEEVFDDEGNYNKTTWSDGDLITDSKLNKIENAIDYLTTEVQSKEELDLSEYITESELNAQGYLTEHQDISHLATKDEIPTVPTNVSAFNNDAGYLTEHQDLSHLATKNEIPSLEGYATEQYVQNAIENAQIGGGDGNNIDLSDYALKTEIPTKTSELTNDSGFITTIPDGYATEQYVQNAVGNIETILEYINNGDDEGIEVYYDEATENLTISGSDNLSDDGNLTI